MAPVGRAVMFDCADTVRAPRVGDAGGSRSGIAGLKPRGVQLPFSDTGVAVVWNLDGERFGDWTLDAEGDEGDSGRRKGEVRGEPKERGEGL